MWIVVTVTVMGRVGVSVRVRVKVGLAGDRDDGIGTQAFAQVLQA